jgi:hypothetical protein
MWLEAFDDLILACDRMRARAQAKPGRYFVYCLETQKVFSVIDTRLSKETHVNSGPTNRGGSQNS